MKSLEEVCLRSIDSLNEIRSCVEQNRSKAFPQWVFDLESCSREVAQALKAESLSLGYSGRVKEDVKQLRNVRQAIIRLSGICSTGGFGLSPEAVCQVISTAIDDLRRHIEECVEA